MALTTAQQDYINNMCSRADDYDIGSQLTNMTTAGAYSDGTITISAGSISDGTATLTGGALSGATLTSPTANDPTVEGLDLDSLAAPTAVYTTDDSLTTEANKVTKGYYEFHATATGATIGEMTSTPVANDVVRINFRATTAATTGALVLSTGGTIGVVGSTAKCVLKFHEGDSITLRAQTTVLWSILDVHTHSTVAWSNHGLATQATA